MVSCGELPELFWDRARKLSVGGGMPGSETIRHPKKRTLATGGRCPCPAACEMPMRGMFLEGIGGWTGQASPLATAAVRGARFREEQSSLVKLSRKVGRRSARSLWCTRSRRLRIAPQVGACHTCPETTAVAMAAHEPSATVCIASCEDQGKPWWRGLSWESCSYVWDARGWFSWWA